MEHTNDSGHSCSARQHHHVHRQWKSAAWQHVSEGGSIILPDAVAISSRGDIIVGCTHLAAVPSLQPCARGVDATLLKTKQVSDLHRPHSAFSCGMERMQREEGGGGGGGWGGGEES